MTSEDTFRKLVVRGENKDLDFKRDPHRLDNEYFKSKFVKDILAMANTPRDGAAYLVLGVSDRKDGTKEFVGVEGHHDDADLQQLVRSNANPCPPFVYESISIDGKSYGVIEVPVSKNGPYLPTRSFGVLRENALYFRRGTENAEASAEERKDIYAWFRASEKATAVNQDAPVNAAGWDKFFLACHHFDPQRLFIFIIGPSSVSTPTAWKAIGRLPLSLILDFDPETESAAYAQTLDDLRRSRSVHFLTLDDRSTLVPERATYWYAAKGLAGRPTATVSDDWRDWNRKYANSLNALIEALARASAGRPVTLVALWYAPQYVREVCASVDRAFGDLADYVFAVPEGSRFDDLAMQFDGTAISVGLDDVLHSIARNVADSSSNVPLPGLPHLDGSFHLINIPDLRWLTEDLEVLHSNIEMEVRDSLREIGKDFLRGAVIDWRDLSISCDAERDGTDRITRQIEAELQSRAPRRFNIYHWPGAGGTTLARRIAWNLRRRYPTVLLKRVTSNETVGRFRMLFQLTSLPILAVVEGAETIPDRIENLYTEVRAEQIPVVFVSVLRRYEVPREGDRTGFLGAGLSVAESYRFSEVYKRFVPARAAQLTEIVDKGSAKERTPFNFALTAFDKEYIGIAKYVEARLSRATAVQRDIITFLALAYYYGHRSVNPQAFATKLGTAQNRVVRLENNVGDLQLELLIRDSDGGWRPAHQLIAAEILEIVLSGNADDRRTWKVGLSSWAVEFIRAMCEGTPVSHEDLLDLIRRMFILRDEHELLGTEGAASSRFARLIDDVQSTEGQLSIFKELVSTFPEEAHFWGHLGRFYSTVLDEPAHALAAIGRAIELDPEDSVLHHMKGMCYRRMVYEAIKDGGRGSENSDDQYIIENVENAKAAFAEARALDPDSEHAHISVIQLLLRVLDWGYRRSAQTDRARFLSSPKSSWYREQLDEAENLLEQARASREGDKPSRYVVDCVSRLNEMYDDYSSALEGWNSLLERNDVFAPPVRRQIVRAYLSRKQHDWSLLSQKEIERIVDLMEANIREEPASSHNIRTWFRAFQLSNRQDIDIAMDKMANWRALGDSTDALYYLYVLHVLKAIDGSMVERIRATDFIQQSSSAARHLRNRTNSFQWLGKGIGLARLRHYTDLGDWDELSDFYTNTAVLDRIEGRIVEIKNPGDGRIELFSCGLPAFFVPAKGGFYRGKDENAKVTMFLGFSYDGLRAWDVKPA